MGYILVVDESQHNQQGSRVAVKLTRQIFPSSGIMAGIAYCQGTVRKFHPSSGEAGTDGHTGQPFLYGIIRELYAELAQKIQGCQYGLKIFLLAQSCQTIADRAERCRSRDNSRRGYFRIAGRNKIFGEKYRSLFAAGFAEEYFPHISPGLPYHHRNPLFYNSRLLGSDFRKRIS